MRTQHSELATRMAHAKLETIAQYIQQHSFPATVHDTCVSFTVPVTQDGIPAGVDRFEVRTFQEARDALGY